MARRKRITGQNERRRKVCQRNNNIEDDDDDEEEEEEDNTLVISDSESDEEEDCAMKMSPRAARRLERGKKAHVQDMTEDEMLDLALKLSKQEATSCFQREQVEDDDMRKALAESLQVCCGPTSQISSKRGRAASKPPHDPDTVKERVRCKLFFCDSDWKDSGSDSEVLAAQTSALRGFEDVGPLPQMPDLSQRTPSQPSPPSSALHSVPSVLSQDKDEASPCESPRSPVVLRQCSVRLSQVPLSSGGSSRNSPCTHNSSPSLTCVDCSQSSPPFPKSPVFPKTDSKRCTEVTFRDCTSPSACKPEVSHKKRDSPTCLAHSKAQQSAENKQDVAKLQRVTDDSSLGAGVSTKSDRHTRTLDEFTSHMVLHLSDDDDEEDEDEIEKIIPPSPVFLQDLRASCADQSKLSPTQPCRSPPTATTAQHPSQTKSQSQTGGSSKSAESRLTPQVEGKDKRLVSYYWGVPFCPKGQSADDYTQVIITQLEVYEKSLKEAQRQLLHKADWGLPVFPCPVERPHGRRQKRHRALQLLEEEDEDEDQEEKENNKRVKRKATEESHPRSEEGTEDGQNETYVVVSSPETQDELRQKSPLLFGQHEATNSAKPSSCRKPVCQDLSEDHQMQSEPDEHREEVQDGNADLENAVCPETQMTEDNTPELMVTSPVQTQLQTEPDVMEVDDAMTAPPADAERWTEQERPGEEQSWRESVPCQVECPMCTRLFPLSKIEIHAAYCNGTVEDHDQHQDQQDNVSQGSTRRKRWRKTEMEGDVRFEKSEQREKCFLCNKFFTSKEYSQHVDQCLQRKTLAPKQGNGLLSALKRSETVHLDDSGAGPSNAAVINNHGLTESSVMHGDSVDPQALGYRVSSSPIKSFTPISELTGCLINFRQQFSDRTSQRLGRKRKFKR